VQLQAPTRPTEFFIRLADSLPEDCRLLTVQPLQPGVKPHPRRIGYQVELTREDAGKTAARIPALLEADSIEALRDYGPDRPSRALEIRPHIESVILDGTMLRVGLLCSDGGAARPGEVLTALGLPADEYNHQVRRVRVDWDIEFADSDTPPANSERKHIGKDKDRRVDQEARGQQEDQEG
jgi:hypothetical protein